MAKLHILNRSGVDQYQVIVHSPTPTGNNMAGFTWAQVINAAGYNKTQMTAGNGPGQTTTSEINSIVAGNTLEANFQFQNDPSWTTAERNAAMDAMAALAINELLARIQADLQWYGATRA